MPITIDDAPNPQVRALGRELQRLKVEDPMKLKEVMTSMTPEELNEVLYNQDYWLRDNQRIRLDDPVKTTHFFLTGRGFGKSFAMLSSLKRCVEIHGMKDMLLICCTMRDAKQNLFPQLVAMYPEHHPNRPEMKVNHIEWPNGARCTVIVSSAGPDSVRGFSVSAIFGDEIAFWENGDDLFTQASLCLRVDPAIAVLATTPVAVPHVLRLHEESQLPNSSVKVYTGSTYDNAANLNNKFLEVMTDRLKGTSMERQELYGEIQFQASGALITAADFDRNTISDEDMPALTEYAIGLDIALIADAKETRKNKNGRKADATGIVVTGKSEDGKIVVVDNYTGSYTASEWAAKTVQLYERYASRYKTTLVVESNAGGRDLISSAYEKIGQKWITHKIKWQFNTQSKMERMMPYALMMEQGKVVFRENMREINMLKTELISFTGKSSDRSPNALDALHLSLISLEPHKKTFVKDLEFLF